MDLHGQAIKATMALTSSWFDGSTRKASRASYGIHSCSWGQTHRLKQIQDKLQGNYGSVLPEDIFSEMAKHNYRYPGISEDWVTYTDTSSDYAGAVTLP
jgi:hypothetical protein